MKAVTQAVVIEFPDGVPIESDWGDFSTDYDVRDAYNVFFGKSNRQIQAEYSKNFVARASDLLYVPPKVFSYYIYGFCDAVLEQRFGDAWESNVADSVITLFEQWAERDPYLLLKLTPVFSSALAFVVENQLNFDADIEIFGDFSKRRDAIFMKLSE